MSEALSPLQPRHWQPAGSVQTACCSLVFRLCFACIPLVFPWVCPAPPPRHSHSAFRTARTTVLQYRDAAAPERVTALLRRESPLPPSRGRQFKSLSAQAQTSRMNRKFGPMRDFMEGRPMAALSRKAFMNWPCSVGEGLRSPVSLSGDRCLESGQPLGRWAGSPTDKLLLPPLTPKIGS
jgi:hypothetical protein